MTGSVFLHYSGAEAQAMQAAIASARSSPDGLADLAPEMGLLVDECLLYPEQMRRLWTFFESRQPVDDVDTLRGFFQRFLDVLEWRLAATEQLLELLPDTTPPGTDAPAAAERLPSALAELRALKDHVNVLLAFLTAPTPPLDRRVLEEAREQIRRGDVTDLGDVIKGLTAPAPPPRG